MAKTSTSKVEDGSPRGLLRYLNFVSIYKYFFGLLARRRLYTM